MYLLGGPHPNRDRAELEIRRLVAAGEPLATDAEVLQELIHRYAALGQAAKIGPGLQIILDMVDEVFPVDMQDVLRASEIVQMPGRWSARDAVHIASMEHRGITRIFSFDRDFDRWPTISRLPRA